MTITREQVADLQPGDVVEITEIVQGHAYIHRGPVLADSKERPGAVNFGDYWLRNASGAPGSWIHTLTVISRAPRPLYVNHPRTEPVAGDVVRDADSADTVTWGFSDTSWYDNVTADYAYRDQMPARLRLLVDGETGRCVP